MKDMHQWNYDLLKETNAELEAAIERDPDSIAAQISAPYVAWRKEIMKSLAEKYGCK